MLKYYIWICTSLFLVTASCSEDVNEPGKSTYSSVMPKVKAENAKLRILAVGNSFTDDACRYIPQLIYNAGEDNDIFFATLTRGNTSLQNHWKNYLNQETGYIFQYNLAGLWKKTAIKTVDKAMGLTDWDIVVFQQLSYLAGEYDSFNPYLENLKGIALENNPDTRIAWQLTWAYASSSTHSGFARYNNDSSEMYDAIIDAAKKVSGQVDVVIPSGILINTLREKNPDSELEMTRDGYHLDTGFPCYAAGCLWHETLITPETGTSCLPDSLSWIREISLQSNPM